MLQNNLLAVKGRLLEMMFEQYRDMNTDSVTGVDYQEFYLEFKSTLKDIQNIDTLNDLEVFLEEYGMNDMDNRMSFPNLVAEAYKDSITTKP